MSDTPQPTTPTATSAVPDTPASTTPAAVQLAPATPTTPAADPWATFKPVEGFDAEAAKGLVEFVKQHKGTPELAAALMKQELESAAKEEAQFKHMAEKGWLEELQKDPVLGGEKVRETMVDTMRAFDKLTPELQTLIKDQGVLYNPIVVRVLHHFGVGLREPTFVRPGTTPSEPQLSLDDRLAGLFTTK